MEYRICDFQTIVLTVFISHTYGYVTQSQYLHLVHEDHPDISPKALLQH